MSVKEVASTFKLSPRTSSKNRWHDSDLDTIRSTIEETQSTLHKIKQEFTSASDQRTVSDINSERPSGKKTSSPHKSRREVSNKAKNKRHSKPNKSSNSRKKSMDVKDLSKMVNDLGIGVESPTPRKESQIGTGISPNVSLGFSRTNKVKRERHVQQGDGAWYNSQNYQLQQENSDRVDKKPEKSDNKPERSGNKPKRADNKQIMSRPQMSPVKKLPLILSVIEVPQYQKRKSGFVDPESSAVSCSGTLGTSYMAGPAKQLRKLPTLSNSRRIQSVTERYTYMNAGGKYSAVTSDQLEIQYRLNRKTFPSPSTKSSQNFEIVKSCLSDQLTKKTSHLVEFQSTDNCPAAVNQRGSLRSLHPEKIISTLETPGRRGHTPPGTSTQQVPSPSESSSYVPWCALPRGKFSSFLCRPSSRQLDKSATTDDSTPLSHALNTTPVKLIKSSLS